MSRSARRSLREASSDSARRRLSVSFTVRSYSGPNVCRRPAVRLRLSSAQRTAATTSTATTIKIHPHAGIANLLRPDSALAYPRVPPRTLPEGSEGTARGDAHVADLGRWSTTEPEREKSRGAVSSPPDPAIASTRERTRGASLDKPDPSRGGSLRRPSYLPP